MIPWHNWLPICLIMTRPFGKAEPSNFLVLVTLILLIYIHFAKWFILPAILLFINQYLLVTVQYAPIIFLDIKVSVKLHERPGENTSTYSVVLCLNPLIRPRFHCMDSHQHQSSRFLWPPCWLNQSGNILCNTHHLLIWGFWFFDAIVQLHVEFIVCLPVIFAVSWIIQDFFPGKPFLGSWNTSRCTIIFTFGRMAMNSFHSAYIQHLSWSSRQILCRLSWWQRWSFRQFKSSCTAMLAAWLGCFYDHFCIWNVSHNS